LLPLPFRKGTTAAEVPFCKSIVGNFMACQDRLKHIYCSYSHTQKLQNRFL